MVRRMSRAVSGLTHEVAAGIEWLYARASSRAEPVTMTLQPQPLRFDVVDLEGEQLTIGDGAEQATGADAEEHLPVSHHDVDRHDPRDAGAQVGNTSDR